MKLILKKATTSQSVYVFIPSSIVGDGSGLTGLVYNSAGLSAYYIRPGGSATAITLATLAAITSAYSSGGFKEADATNMPGVYRLDLPDAVLATGVSSVLVMLKGAANMVPVLLEIQLVSFDPDDTVRLGLTAIPNATPAGVGGLPTVDASNAVKLQAGTGANQIDLTTGQVKVQSGTAAGQLDITAGVVKANLVQILATALTETAGQIAAAFRNFFNVAAPTLTCTDVNQTGDSYARIGAAGASLTDVGGMSVAMKAQVRTEATGAITDKKLDNLMGPVGTLVANSGFSTTVLGDVGGLPVNANADNFFTGMFAIFLTGGQAGAARKITADIYSLISGQHQFTIQPALAAAPLNGDTLIIVHLVDEAMRGTNNAALAVNYTATRAGYLDNLSGGAVGTLANQSTLLTRIPDVISLANITSNVWAAATRTLTALGAGPVAEIWNALTSGMVTVGSVGKRIADNLDGTISGIAASVWAAGTRTLTSFGTLVTDIWANATRTLTAISDSAGVTTLLSRIPDTISLTAIAGAVWNALTSGMVTIGSIGKKLADWVIGTTQTGDSFARLGAPAGASVSADIAAVKADTGTTGVVVAASAKTGYELSANGADLVLKKDLTGMTGEARRSVLNTIRKLLNRVSRTVGSGTLTVYKEDDLTTAYTETITTDATAVAIKESDPV